MNIEALFDALVSSTGDEWRAASDELWLLGYSWEWIFHRDGTEVFLLKDKELEQKAGNDERKISDRVD